MWCSAGSSLVCRELLYTPQISACTMVVTLPGKTGQRSSGDGHHYNEAL
jgi:hypothetical protein